MKQFKDVDFVDKFLKSLHVDDFSSGGDTINDVYTFFMRSRSALTKTCFNLRKFESNSTELDNLVKPERPGTEDDTKILGLTWNISTFVTACCRYTYETRTYKISCIDL